MDADVGEAEVAAAAAAAAAVAIAVEMGSTVGLTGMEEVFELYMEDIGLLEDVRLAEIVVDLVVAVQVGNADHSSGLLVLAGVIGLLELLKATQMS